MCLKWIEIFPKYADVYKLAQVHTNLYLVDKKAAIACCAYEIFEMIGYSLGLNERINRVYRRFGNLLEYRSELVDQEFMQTNGILLSHLGKFADMGGFKALQDLVNCTNDYKCPI